MNGYPVTYESWGPGEPDGTDDKNCVSMGHFGDTTWDVRKCNKEYDFICQRPKQDYEYKVFDDSLNWHDARDVCLEWGGDLATVRDQEEQELLF
jgi:hypothetical protein